MKKSTAKRASPGTTPWRVGRKVGRTLYDKDDCLIGMVDTPDMASLVVDAVNGYWGMNVEPEIVPGALSTHSATAPTPVELPPEVLAVLRNPDIPLPGEHEAMQLVLARGCRPCLGAEHPYWHMTGPGTRHPRSADNRGGA